jgi:glycosyltransferase involved in cell wall biosynthesis
VKNKPLVSVVIPVYNRSEYICEAIDSVLAQTYKNHEIIVVDDGSSNNVKQVLEPYLGKIKYFYQENKGLAATRNTGIKNSNGMYLAFLDDDDLFEPRKLKVQVAILENNPQLGFVYSDCYEFETNHESEAWLNLAVARDKPSNEFAKLFFADTNIRIPTPLIRRQCFDDIGLFDESLPQHEDGDVLLRIALQWQVEFSDYPSARVRHHVNSMSRDRIGMNKSIIKSSEKILALHPEFKESLGISANDRLAELHFLLGKAYLQKRMIRISIKQFKSSRALSKKYVNMLRTCRALLKIAFKLMSRLNIVRHQAHLKY